MRLIHDQLKPSVSLASIWHAYLSYAKSSSNNRFQLWTSNDGSANKYVIIQSAGELIPDGVWTRVSASYNSSNGAIKLYIDNVEQTPTYSDLGAGGNINDNNFLTGIGCSYEDGAMVHQYDGLIDDVRVWNTLITDFSLEEELEGNEANLIGYWKLNNNYADSTSNDNDLTTVNTPVFSIDVPFETGSGVSTSTTSYVYGTTTTASKKYIGEYYDEESNLSYLNARYYEGSRGQFLSQDPVFWEIGQTKNGRRALSDPQSMNSYSYAGNNPITQSDPTGRWYKEFITGQQSWSSFYGEVGEAAGYLGQQSPVWNYAMNNPYTTGAAIGVGSGAVAYGGVAGLTYLSTEYAGGLGTACLAFCGTVGQQSARYAEQISRGVTNPKLGNIIKNVYQSTDKLPGGTFGAVRNEIITGQPTGGTFHFTKMADTLRGIQNVINSGNVSQGDLKAIQTLVNNAAKAVAEITKMLK